MLKCYKFVVENHHFNIILIRFLLNKYYERVLYIKKFIDIIIREFLYYSEGGSITLTYLVISD